MPQRFNVFLPLVAVLNKPGLFTMRGRRPGESLFHWGIVPGLWFRQFTHDVKFTNLQYLPPRPENHFKGKTRRLSSSIIPDKSMFLEIVPVCSASFKNSRIDAVGFESAIEFPVLLRNRFPFFAVGEHEPLHVRHQTDDPEHFSVLADFGFEE